MLIDPLVAFNVPFAALPIKHRILTGKDEIFHKMETIYRCVPVPNFSYLSGTSLMVVCHIESLPNPNRTDTTCPCPNCYANGNNFINNKKPDLVLLLCNVHRYRLIESCYM